MEPSALAKNFAPPFGTVCWCSAVAPQLDDAASPGDWHTLLLAVRTRLREVVDAWPVPADTPAQQAAAAASRALALDCADALDHLHLMLVGHRECHTRLQAELQQVRAALGVHADAV
jgi:hypothetical protein